MTTETHIYRIRITEWVREDIASREIDSEPYTRIAALPAKGGAVTLSTAEVHELLDDADYQSDAASGFEDMARRNAYGALKRQCRKALDAAQQ